MHIIQLVSTRLSESERDKVVPLILEGYREAATEAGSSVSGGVPSHPSLFREVMQKKFANERYRGRMHVSDGEENGV